MLYVLWGAAKIEIYTIRTVHVVYCSVTSHTLTVYRRMTHPGCRLLCRWRNRDDILTRRSTDVAVASTACSSQTTPCLLEKKNAWNAIKLWFCSSCESQWWVCSILLWEGVPIVIFFHFDRSFWSIFPSRRNMRFTRICLFSFECNRANILLKWWIVVIFSLNYDEKYSP